MVADVSYLVRIMNEQQRLTESSPAGVKSTALITRDLLGGGCTLDAKELDLDLQVPSGWEKRLDLKSGKVYLQRCNSPSTPSSSAEHKQQSNNTVPKFQDLNFPPASKQPLNLFDDTNLDLKLVVPLSSTPSSSSSSPCYQSVCTLDKVKSALERAEKETIKKRSMSVSMSKSSSPRSNSSSAFKETGIDEGENSSYAFAAGCPSCLLYVLISKSNPKCPRCNMIVPSPTAMKKPRIDLNISI